LNQPSGSPYTPALPTIITVFGSGSNIIKLGSDSLLRSF
jgi:hypothetical protein